MGGGPPAIGGGRCGFPEGPGLQALRVQDRADRELACAADGMSKSAGAMFNFRGYCGDSQAKRGLQPTCRLFIVGFAELKHESMRAGTALNKHWIIYESTLIDTPAAFLAIDNKE
jgi:hypothetical protein